MLKLIWVEIDKYLENNDSNSFFKEVGTLLNCGYTGTNVTDVALIFVE